MRILIVSATYQEASPLFKLLEMLYIPEISFYQGLNYKNKTIDILITGVGMISTTYWTAKILHENTYNLAINIGIAGSFNHSFKLGEAVNVTRETFSEIGVEEKDSFESAFDIGLIGSNDKPYKNGILENEFMEFGPLSNLPKVKGITVNTVHGNKDSIAKVIDYFNPDVETMEGASFAYCCLMDNLDYIQLRTISNYVEERDISTWDVALAIDTLNEKIKEFLDDENN